MSDVVIRISGDVKKYEEALAKAEKETFDLNETLTSAAKASAIAFAALTAEVVFAVKAFADGEQATNKLKQAMQNQGIASDALLKSYKAQADELQRKAAIDDDLVIKGQAVLQNFIGQEAISKELTFAIADLSAQTGTDLVGAFEAVGRGINGNVKGLKQYGLVIDESADKQERMDKIIEQLNQKFGGAAEAAAQGTGSIKGLALAFEDVQKALGERLAPIIVTVTATLTKLLNFISENKGISDFATSVLIAGTVVTGLVTALSTVGIGLLALRAALAAAKIEVSAMTIATRGLVAATGLGLLLILVTEIALNWNTIWPRMQAVFSAFVNNVKDLLGGLGTLLAGVFTLDVGKVQSGLATLKETLKKGFAEATKELKIEPEIVQDGGAKARADKAAAESKRQDDLRIAAKRANNEALKLESERASTELIALKKAEAQLLDQLRQEDDAKNREAIQKKIEDNKILQEQAKTDQLEQRSTFNQELLAQNDEFQALDEEQQAAFLARNEQAFQAQLLTENQARQKAAQDRLDIQVKEHNTFLLNQQKFGTAYALINQIMNSAMVKGAQTAFGELAQLQQSSNSTLKGIGKAAATAQIIFKTAESAMNIYAGFSTIPIIGPALGVAGAAAAIAFGAEQIGKVQAAAKGGLMEGGIPGIDSIPTLTQQGELVVPNKNFDEVVDSVADKRAGVTESGPPGFAEIVLSIKDDLIDMIEAKIVERQKLNISIQGV